jgi:hypothetical protein
MPLRQHLVNVGGSDAEHQVRRDGDQSRVASNQGKTREAAYIDRI